MMMRGRPCSSSVMSVRYSLDVTTPASSSLLDFIGAFRRMVETAERAVEVIAFKDAELEQLIAILEKDEARRGRGGRQSMVGSPTTVEGKKMARFSSDDPSTAQQAIIRQRTLPIRLNTQEEI